MKNNSMDDWQHFMPGWNGTGFGGFLLKTPDLRKTPVMKLKAPPNKDEVQKRLDSEETRISSAKHMKDLRDLVEDVYTDKTEKFHWDLSSDVEIMLTVSSEVGILGATADTDNASELVYKTNQFVAIRPDAEGDTNRFWIGKISKAHESAAGATRSLTVQWFEKGIGQDEFDAVYKPCTFRKGRKTTVWTREVDVAAVLVTFDGLTNRKKLSEETRKRLRQTIGMAT